ncbi:MAG: NCS2 family permease [Lentisphaerae bacterium]|jgi:AGZA family xanthine/uracil permease-like MFS transporter|nr:NCS2 family permease [Lentisphaerota bacterium]
MNVLARFFRLAEAGTSVRKEIIGGVTTFLTMAYVIFVIPAMLSDPAIGMPKGALITATILATIYGTLVVALYGRVPFAMAPGMGLGAYFAYSLCIGSGIAWPVALGAVFISGCLFLLLGILGIRRLIAAGIPESLQLATAAGIGLFVMFIGLKNLGVVVAHPSTLVAIGPWSVPMALGVAGILICGMLASRNVTGGLLIGMALTTLLGMIVGQVPLPQGIVSVPPGIGEIVGQLDVRGALTPALIGPIFALMFVDMFDSIGTMIACGRSSGILDNDATMNKLDRALRVDASATVLGAVLGVPSVTTYVESAAGISAGARTGLASVVTAGCFIIALWFAPLISMVPVFATAPVLVIAGVYMFRSIRHLDFSRLDELIPAVLTIILMPLTYTISVGIAAGFLSWTLLKVMTGRIRDVRPSMWLCSLLALVALMEMILPGGLPL